MIKTTLRNHTRAPATVHNIYGQPTPQTALLFMKGI